MSHNLYFSECIRTNPDQFDTLYDTVQNPKWQYPISFFLKGVHLNKQFKQTNKQTDHYTWVCQNQFRNIPVILFKSFGSSTSTLREIGCSTEMHYI